MAEQPSQALERTMIDPAKLMRLQSMLGAVLDEMRPVSPEDPAAAAAAAQARRAVVEVGSALPDRELAELGLLIGPIDAALTIGESRVIEAQLLGWLGGLEIQHRWEGLQAMMAVDRQRALRDQEEVASEARRRARGVV